MIWFLEDKDNVTPPRLDLRIIKKMKIPIPLHVPEGSTAERAPEQNIESDGETSSSTPSVPQPSQPSQPTSARIHISDAVVEAIAAKVAANLEPAFKTIYEGMADMNTALHSKIDGLASLVKSYLDPSMSTSPIHTNLSPHHSPHTSPVHSPHPTQISPLHTSPIPSHKSPSASPLKSSTPSPSPSQLPPPSPPSQPLHTDFPPPAPHPEPQSEPQSSPTHISPITFAQTYARKGKGPIIASPEPSVPHVDDDKKGEKRHSVPTVGESSAVQELASKAASILSSIAAEANPNPADEATATLDQILPEIHQVAEGIRVQFVEDVLIEDVTGEEPESDYVNTPPENPKNVLEEEEDMSRAMVVYEEPQPVTVDTFPHIRRMVREFVERMEEQEKERNEREKARAERAAAAEVQAKAKTEEEKQAQEEPKPAFPKWGAQKVYIYGKKAKAQDPIQTTSEFLDSGGEEERGPEVQSTKRLRVKMTAPKPPQRQIPSRASRASKGIVIEEPKPAPRSVTKAAPKRKAASKAKSTKPPPKKKQKQPTLLDRISAMIKPSSPPKKKKAPARKAPAKKKKAEPEPEIEEEELLMDPSVSSGGYSSESGDYVLKSKFTSSSSNSD